MIPENQNKVLDTQEIEELQSDLEGLKTELEDMKTNLEQNLQEVSSDPTPEPSEDPKDSEEVENVAHQETAEVAKQVKVHAASTSVRAIPHA